MEAQSLPRTGRLFLPRSPKVLSAFSDERLVDQVRRGNDDAFEAIYDRHHRGILSFCRHMLGSPDEAEDAVQQTFISAYDAIRADARDLRVKPWLYAIARNRCLSILRARREQPAELDDVPTVGLSEEVQGRADLRELLHDLHGLPVDQRAALVLSEVGGLTHSEVGTVVGCEVGKVKSLVFQARSSLIETRRAREMPCSEIREQLATLTGGALRRGPLRRHVRECAGCAEFRDEVMRQRKALAALLPVVPTLGLKHSALAAIGFGGGGGSGGAAVGGGIASLASSGAAVKVATVFVAAGVAAGGGALLDQRGHSPEAEAAGGQNGNTLAWPAPAAGTGPGAPRLFDVASHPRPAQRTAVKTRPVASKPGATGSDHPSAAAPPSANGGVKQHGHHHAPAGGGHVSQPQAQPDPAPATPAPTTPAAPHSNHGHHYGWTQGLGHQHHEQDSGGVHVPSGSRGDSSGGGDASHGDHSGSSGDNKDGGH